MPGPVRERHSGAAGAAPGLPVRVHGRGVREVLPPVPASVRVPGKRHHQPAALPLSRGGRAPGQRPSPPAGHAGVHVREGRRPPGL